jgi:hypothetical protein
LPSRTWRHSVAHQPPRRLQPRHGEPPVNRLAPEPGDDDAQQMIS